MEENISVSARVRPIGDKEEGQECAWDADGKSIWQIDRPEIRFGVDNIFGPMDTTRHIYDTALHLLVNKVVAGFNSTIFAYGQTSSGKTYTMQGIPEEPGVITLAVEDVFRAISNCPAREFLCRVSYMELYNEEVNDLLQPTNVKLPIHEDKDSKVYVAGLTEEIVHDAESVLRYLASGDENRHIASTKMNDRSSRSHTVFKMIVESRSQDQSDECVEAGAVLVSALTLVDLAGSERVSKTGTEGLRMKEGTAINKSLLTLGIVINQLASNASAVSYRDSKLTRILQPSLGGNAKTAILCNVTPANCHVEESSNTMRFACRAKKVVNSCTLNEVLSDAALMKRQAKEIEQLKKRLQESGMIDVEDQICKMRNELLRSEHEKELALIKLEEEKAEKEKAQRQVQVAAQLMFEKGGSTVGAFFKAAKRRDTWCPGANSEEETDAAGNKRGSGGEIPESPLSDMHSLRGEYDLMMPPPSQRRKTSGMDSGEQRTSKGSFMEEDLMSDDPALLEQLLAKAKQDNNSLTEKMNELTRANQEKDNQIRNVRKDLHAVIAAKHGAAKSPLLQKSPEGSKFYNKRKREEGWDSLNRELERRNKRLRKRCDEVLEINENLEMLALDALNEADASKQAAGALYLDLESAQATVEKAKEDVHLRNIMVEELQSQLNNAQDELRGIRGRLEDEDDSMGAAERIHKEEVSVYQQQIDDLQKERDDLQTRLSSQEQRLKSRGEAQSAKRGDKNIGLSTKETNRLKKKTDDAEAKVRSLVREKADLQNEKNGLQRQMRGLEKALERLTKDVERKDAVFEKRKETLAGEVNKAKDNLADLEKKLKASKLEVEEKDSGIKVLEGETINLKKQVQEDLKEINRLHQLHAAVKSELDGCEVENENLKRRSEQVSAAMDELRCELVEAEAARDVNAQKVHALLSENQAICDQSGALSSEMSRLSLFLKESLQKRSDIVEYVKKEFMVEKERIVSDLKAAEEAQATAQSDMHSKCMEVEALRNELLELSTLAEEQKKVLEEQHQSSDAAKKALQDALVDQESFAFDLRQKILTLEESNEELKENLQGATKHLATVTDGRAQETWAWQKKLQEVEKECSEMLDSTRHERDALQQSLDSAQAVIESKERKLCEVKENFQHRIQDLENQVKTLSADKAETQALKAKLAKAESVTDQIRKELGEEIRKLCADLTVKSEEIAQYGKEKEALQKLVDAGIRQTQSEYMKKMDQQKQDLLHELGKVGRTVEMQQQKIKELEDAAEAHIKFKDMAKNKMLSKLKEVQEKERLASKFQCEYSALKNECEHLSAQKEKTQREMESWRALAKSEQSTEMWINTLVEKIYTLQSRLKNLEEDFDSQNMHLPTMHTAQAQLDALQEDVLKAKRAEHELQGVQTALRREIERVGWDPKKLDTLLEATKKEYKVKYYQGKTQRLAAKLKVSEEKTFELDAELREIRKRIPPNRIEVDISRLPPRIEGGTPKKGPSCVTNIPRSNWSAGRSENR